MQLYAAPVLLLLACTLFFMGLARMLTGADEEVEDRLKQFANREDYTFVTGEEDVAMFGDEEQGKKGNFLARFFEKNTNKDDKKTIALKDELARADLKLKASEWNMIQFGVVLAAIVVGIIVFRNVVLGPLLGVVGFFLPRFYLRRRQGQRLSSFNKMLSDAIVMLANSLRAGYSFLQSMEVLSQEMPDPIAGEFNRVVREVGLGRTQQQALNNLVRRIPSEDLDMMITAVNVQQEVGGNLAEILDTLAHTIRERVRIQGEIRVLVAQQMMAGYVITFLPVALAGMLFLLNREYMSKLYTTQCGWIMIGTSILMISSGFFAIQKIVSIEV
ncbi:MAG: type II secretion system F family protein [Ardenticatenales bacterium]|nr:type II secretion system F family protein [Ardenticatenales bacterium]